MFISFSINSFIDVIIVIHTSIIAPNPPIRRDDVNISSGGTVRKLKLLKLTPLYLVVNTINRIIIYSIIVDIITLMIEQNVILLNPFANISDIIVNINDSTNINATILILLDNFIPTKNTIVLITRLHIDNKPLYCPTKKIEMIKRHLDEEIAFRGEETGIK